MMIARGLQSVGVADELVDTRDVKRYRFRIFTEIVIIMSEPLTVRPEVHLTR